MSRGRGRGRGDPQRIAAAALAAIAERHVVGNGDQADTADALQRALTSDDPSGPEVDAALAEMRERSADPQVYLMAAAVFTEVRDPTEVLLVRLFELPVSTSTRPGPGGRRIRVAVGRRRRHRRTASDRAGNPASAGHRDLPAPWRQDCTPHAAGASPRSDRHVCGCLAEVGHVDATPLQLGEQRLCGTLYTALDRLAGAGLVEPDRSEVVDGRARRYYRLTASGTAALLAEAARLAEMSRIVADAVRQAGSARPADPAPARPSSRRRRVRPA